MKNNRFLIKLSGEILKTSEDSGISLQKADEICKKIVKIVKSGIQLGIVIGGGNIFRGGSFSNAVDTGYDRVMGDQIGMMATVVNGLTLIERFNANGVHAILQSGINIDGVAGLFDKSKVEETFKNNGIVVFCGGIGNPYFSTDTTCVLRALQIGAGYIFKLTKVDGIYDKDPAKNQDAKILNKTTFDEIIDKRLEIMDLSAAILMQKNKIKLMVFNMNDFNLLEKACRGEKVGSVVEN